MVFCKECRRNVEDCPHFVVPIAGERIPVFDAKVVSLAMIPRNVSSKLRSRAVKYGSSLVFLPVFTKS